MKKLKNLEIIEKENLNKEEDLEMSSINLELSKLPYYDQYISDLSEDDINETNYICFENKNTEIIPIKDERDEKIEKFRKIVSNFNISENKEDIIESKDNVTYQMTTTDNQKNNTNKNISSIDLGECEKILKDKYKIE